MPDQVYSGEFFPTDMVCLASSNPTGECHIETSNLDGYVSAAVGSNCSLNGTRFRHSTAIRSVGCHLIFIRSVPDRHVQFTDG